MMLVEETSVPSVALPVTEFKAHLKLGSGFSDESLQDSVLESFLRAAIASIEARTGKILIQRSFSWTLGMWRTLAGQSLPVAPVSSVVSLKLIDRLGGEVTVTPSSYRLVADLQVPQLRPVGRCLPTIPTEGQIVIQFLAGYGIVWSDVPSDLQQAVLMLAAHFYEHRTDTALTGGCMPFGVTSLIERYRPVRLHLGVSQ